MNASLPAAAGALSFGGLLRFWRLRRGYSQLSLALAGGVSQRHLSFLEVQRASPSRALVLRLARVLEVPPRQRDRMLLAAGFAAMSAALPNAEPRAAVEKAVQLILQHHEPYPAIVLDRFWNILQATEGWNRLVSAGVDAGTLARLRDAQGRLNLMRLVLEPDGLRPLIDNWNEVAPYLSHRIEEDLALRPIDDEAQAAFDAIEALLRKDKVDDVEQGAGLPVLPVVLRAGELRISLFSTMTMLGTARDAAMHELRIESFFPADAASEAALLRVVSAGQEQEIGRAEK